jgi:5-oxopent-3-ene-1,2,5-tricarboxylate decarboxylase / 2-hydroxyhepta-2,4-diene-1,7-dioate isomerase
MNSPDLLSFAFAPYRLSGMVVGALLNHAPQLDALGDAVRQPPHKAPPQAPVLQVKPRHTLAADGDPIVVPAEAGELEVGASLGIVIGRVACRVQAAAALGVVAGYTIVHDVSVPVASHYRPSVRLKARDGFCPIGPRVVPVGDVRDADALAVRIDIDGVTVQRTTTGERVRGVAQLIADVSEFMTLQPGDVLMLGAAAGAPRARPGQRVAITIEGLGTLRNALVAEPGALA